MPPEGGEAVGIQTELARPSTLPIRRSGIQTTLKLGTDGNSEIINGRCAERKLRGQIKFISNGTIKRHGSNPKDWIQEPVIPPTCAPQLTYTAGDLPVFIPVGRRRSPPWWNLPATTSVRTMGTTWNCCPCQQEAGTDIKHSENPVSKS
jgi:hypothetical protein